MDGIWAPRILNPILLADVAAPNGFVGQESSVHSPHDLWAFSAESGPFSPLESPLKGGEVSLTPPQQRDFISIEILYLFCSVHTNLNPDLEEYWGKQEICQGFCTHPLWAEKAR